MCTGDFLEFLCEGPCYHFCTLSGEPCRDVEACLHRAKIAGLIQDAGECALCGPHSIYEAEPARGTMFYHFVTGEPWFSMEFIPRYEHAVQSGPLIVEDARDAPPAYAVRDLASMFGDPEFMVSESARSAWSLPRMAQIFSRPESSRRRTNARTRTTEVLDLRVQLPQEFVDRSSRPQQFPYAGPIFTMTNHGPFLDMPPFQAHVVAWQCRPHLHDRRGRGQSFGRDLGDFDNSTFPRPMRRPWNRPVPMLTRSDAVDVLQHMVNPPIVGSGSTGYDDEVASRNFRELADAIRAGRLNELRLSPEEAVLPTTWNSNFIDTELAGPETLSPILARLPGESTAIRRATREAILATTPSTLYSGPVLSGNALDREVLRHMNMRGARTRHRRSHARSDIPPAVPLGVERERAPSPEEYQMQPNHDLTENMTSPSRFERQGAPSPEEYHLPQTSDDRPATDPGTGHTGLVSIPEFQTRLSHEVPPATSRPDPTVPTLFQESQLRLHHQWTRFVASEIEDDPEPPAHEQESRIRSAAPSLLQESQFRLYQQPDASLSRLSEHPILPPPIHTLELRGRLSTQQRNSYERSRRGQCLAYTDARRLWSVGALPVHEPVGRAARMVRFGARVLRRLREF